MTDADNALLDREADPPTGESFAAWHARKRAAETKRKAKRRAEIVDAMHARGATYSDDSFYGLVHESAHGIDLGCDRFDRASINARIAPKPARERMLCEVVAHAATREVCRCVGVTVFDNSVHYSAVGTLAFAAVRGETDVDWTVYDFAEADRVMAGSERVVRLVRAILTMTADDAALPKREET